MMRQVGTYIDRYPAKMVARLATKLVSRYESNCTALLDPFCGSGAILRAATERQIPVMGFDVNPYAVLLSGVKVEGFDLSSAERLCAEFVSEGNRSSHVLPIDWDAKHYWFTPATVHKYERLRHAGSRMSLRASPEGRAVLLAFALSVRRCSRADQRSPKPFISKHAIARRKGRHYDPSKEIQTLFKELGELYSRQDTRSGRVVLLDLTSSTRDHSCFGKYSHVITSPPYINAQDYFRNFKLELYLLEGLLPFAVDGVKHRFVGTERGSLTTEIPTQEMTHHRELLPVLRRMEGTHPRQASVVHRYLFDMSKAFEIVKQCLKPGGVMVIVCGDNLVGGYRISTWQVLNRLLNMRGFVLFDQFGDKIACRNVPPQRHGHKGLIKQEVISAFRLDG